MAITRKEIVAAEEAVLPNPPVAETEPAKAGTPNAESAKVPVKAVHFVKNINPHEKIIFKDKSEFCFGNTLLVTADEALIEKISAVATQYGICTQ